MGAQAKPNPDKAEVLAWALDKLAAEDYLFVSEGLVGRWELIISQWESEDVQTVRHLEGALASLTGTSDPLPRLAESLLDSEKLSTLAKSAGMSPVDYLRSFLESPLRVYFGLRSTELRFQLGSKSQASADSMAELKLDTSDSIAAAVLANIARLYPNLIERIQSLSALPSDESVPDLVQAYLREASQCYVYGRFIACLIVCRSAIEFAIRDRLVACGADQKLKTLSLNREDGLKNLIEMAKGGGGLPWTLCPTLKCADQVREAARKAVHSGEPSPVVCKEMFEKTRGVLSELYTKQDPMSFLQQGRERK